MISVLNWFRSIFLSVLNGLARLVVVVVLLLVLLLVVISLAHGDGIPAKAVLALDLRGAIPSPIPAMASPACWCPSR